jgi:hypothetical protein
VTTEAGGNSPGVSQAGVVEAVTLPHLEDSDSEQLAQYLRDHAIQRIFAVGLGITALAARLDEPQVQLRLAEYVDDLDVAISAIYVAVSKLTTDVPA